MDTVTWPTFCRASARTILIHQFSLYVRLFICHVLILYQNVLRCHHAFFIMVLVFQALNILTKFRWGDALRGRWIQVGYINCAIFCQIGTAATTKYVVDVSPSTKKLPRVIFASRCSDYVRGQPGSRCHHKCPIYFSPSKTLPRPVKKLSRDIYACSIGYCHWCPSCFFPREKIPSPCEKLSTKITVVILCALLTHYLLAIAKFLVKLRNRLLSRKCIKLDSSNLVCMWCWQVLANEK